MAVTHDDVYDNGNGQHDDDIGGKWQLVGRREVQICLWPGRISWTKKGFWGLLRAENLRVMRLKAVHQSSGQRRRFDIFVRPAQVDHTLQTLQALADAYDWHVRRHVPFSQRQRHTPPKGDGGADKPCKSLRIATVNINGMATRNKKVELTSVAQRAAWDVICVQETRLKAVAAARCRIAGFTAVHACEEANEAKRGVAIFVRAHLITEPLVTHPHLVMVRVRAGERSVIVGSTYIPGTRGATRVIGQEVWTEVGSIVRAQRARFPDVPLVLGGDFNQPGAMMPNRLSAWNAGMALQPCSGSPLTWHTPLNKPRARGRQKRWTDIDHFAVSQPHANGFSRARVNRLANMSDHFAVECQALFVNTPEPMGVASRTEFQFDARAVAANHAEIINAEPFVRMASTLVNGEVEQSDAAREDRANAFHDAVNTVATQLGLHQTPNKRRVTYHMHRSAKRAIEARRTEAARLSRLPEVTEAEAAHYAGLEDAAAEAVVRSVRATRRLFLLQAMRLNRTRDHRGLWQWLRRCAYLARGKSTVQSMVDSRGDLQITPEGVAAVFTEHYSELAKDLSGHGTDLDYWRALLKSREYPRVATCQPIKGAPSAETLAALNRAVNYSEVMGALRSMASHKAPGPSGITVDFLKAALAAGEDPDRRGTYVECAFGKAIFQLVSDLVMSGYVCSRQRVAHVVPIFKGKGSPTDPGCYRGISLIDSILKLACVVVNRRLRDALEKSKTLNEQQAGFRPKRDTMGQVVGLLEACQQHRAMNATSSVAFVDIQKAFDTVPHAALFAKLEAAGYSGRILQFLQGLYATSKIAVATPCGVGQPFQLSRGTRQGDPLSPSLFNVFINDLIPVIATGSVPTQNGCFLYADDIALLQIAKEGMVCALRDLTKWAVANEINFGVPACGVMEIAAATRPVEPVEPPPVKPFAIDPKSIWGPKAEWYQPRPYVDDGPPLTLQGEPIPKVNVYKYLGIVFNDELNVQDMAVERAQAVHKCVSKWRPLLTASTVPIYLRAKALVGTVFASARYGSELYGLEKKPTAVVARELDAAVRLVVGLRENSRRTCMVTLQAELGIPSLWAVAGAQRVTALLKGLGSETTIAKLLLSARPKPGFKIASWAYTTWKWIQRFAKREAPIIAEILEQRRIILSESQIAEMRKLVLKYLQCQLVRQRTTGSTLAVSLANYVRQGFLKTRRYLRILADRPDLATGTRSLLHARVGAYLTARYLACAKLIPSDYLQNCPFCGSDAQPSIEPDTLQHTLLRCSRWDAERNELLSPLLADMGRVNGLLTDDNKVTLLLGGVITAEPHRLTAWAGALPTKECNLADVLQTEFEDVCAATVYDALSTEPTDSEWVAAICDTDSCEIAAAPCIEVARFFQRISGLRRATLGPLMKQRADAQPGMAGQTGVEDDPIIIDD